MGPGPDDAATDRLVIVVDDDAAVRDSLRLLLLSAGYRCAGHPSGEALLAAGLPPAAACLLVDLHLPPGMDGVSLIAALHAAGRGIPAVVVSGRGDIAAAVRAMRAGASDFLEKPYSDTALLGAVGRAIAEGDAAADRARAGEAAAERLARLSPREREVLAALASGQPNKGIAHGLGLGVRTVEAHRARMMEKLGVRSLGEAVRLAVAGGLVP